VSVRNSRRPRLPGPHPWRSLRLIDNAKILLQIETLSILDLVSPPYLVAMMWPAALAIHLIWFYSVKKPGRALRVGYAKISWPNASGKWKLGSAVPVGRQAE
jgi:hypothetical protein